NTSLLLELRIVLQCFKNQCMIHGKSYTSIHQREETWQTRPKKYSELTEAQQLQDDFDVQATNIILHELPPDVYALVNHQEVAKDI
nr:hypothetical protein [Tanacetum cinerariifolium]